MCIATYWAVNFQLVSVTIKPLDLLEALKVFSIQGLQFWQQLVARMAQLCSLSTSLLSCTFINLLLTMLSSFLSLPHWLWLWVLHVGCKAHLLHPESKECQPALGQHQPAVSILRVGGSLRLGEMGWRGGREEQAWEVVGGSGSLRHQILTPPSCSRQH